MTAEWRGDFDSVLSVQRSLYDGRVEVHVDDGCEHAGFGLTDDQAREVVARLLELLP